MGLPRPSLAPAPAGELVVDSGRPPDRRRIGDAEGNADGVRIGGYRGGIEMAV
ncbi:hypothetical protein LRS74_08400 [Streptomyces sp. LX-29]|uniref:hypothetical protein n=1 Tax=Streptomyces sp. LX-29 TaxID=2900152 RepID=UPI00240D323B|nr:hypothetical protein [Streptomyces sp. LX-29]WFB07070.1 hypothetical protein LRS74_08400 [Streptomyces sp. LX-29]